MLKYKYILQIRKQSYQPALGNLWFETTKMMIAVKKKQIYRASFIAIFRTLWFAIAPGTPPAASRPAAHHYVITCTAG